MTEEEFKTLTKKSGWDTREIMITTLISIVLGIILIPLQYAGSWGGTAFPLFASLWYGLYTWPAIMVAYLMRRKGSALFTMLIVGLVQIPFTPSGFMIIILQLIIGLPVELLFLITGYKNFKWWFIMIVGAVGVIPPITISFIMFGFQNLDPLLQVAYYAGGMISGALIGGLFGKVIGDALIKTGAISKITPNP